MNTAPARPAVDPSSAPTIQLPELLPLLENLALAGRLAELYLPQLRARVERNRRRSERCRQRHAVASNGDGNGHHSDVALKLTPGGFALECRRCGRRLNG